MMCRLKRHANVILSDVQQDDSAQLSPRSLKQRSGLTLDGNSWNALCLEKISFAVASQVFLCTVGRWKCSWGQRVVDRCSGEHLLERDPTPAWFSRGDQFADLILSGQCKFRKSWAGHTTGSTVSGCPHLPAGQTLLWSWIPLWWRSHGTALIASFIAEVHFGSGVSHMRWRSLSVILNRSFWYSPQFSICWSSTAALQHGRVTWPCRRLACTAQGVHSPTFSASVCASWHFRGPGGCSMVWRNGFNPLWYVNINLLSILYCNHICSSFNRHSPIQLVYSWTFYM